MFLHSEILLSAASIALGVLASWYYTGLLIDPYPFMNLVKGTGLYLGWIIFLLTFTVFLSSRLKSSGLVAVCALLVSILLSLSTSLLGKWMEWSPAQLTTAASSYLVDGRVEGPLLLPLVITGVLVVIFLFLSTANWQRK